MAISVSPSVGAEAAVAQSTPTMTRSQLKKLRIKREKDALARIQRTARGRAARVRVASIRTATNTNEQMEQGEQEQAKRDRKGAKRKA